MSDTNKPVAASNGKYWPTSLTLWGVGVTTLTTVAPLVAKALGFDLTPETITLLGSQITALVQAIGGLVGTCMTIAGRVRATQPLTLTPEPSQAVR